MGKGRVTPREIAIYALAKEAKRTVARLIAEQQIQPLSDHEEVELIYATETVEAAQIIIQNAAQSMKEFDFSGADYN